MVAKFLPHVERLEAVAVSDSGRIAIAGRREAKGAPSSVYVARLPKLEGVVSLELGDGIVALAFVGDILCAGDLSGNLHAIEVGDGLRALAVDKARHKGAIRALLAVGEQVASVGDDGVLVLSEVKGSGLSNPRKHRLSTRALRALAVDEQGTTIAAGGDDGIARSLALAAVGGAMAPREMNMGKGVGALCFLGDGRIAAGCADGGLRLAFLEGDANADDRAKDAAHSAPVRALIYSAPLVDAAKRALPRRLISVSEDGEIKAWEVDTRRKPVTTTVSSSALTAAVLIPGAARSKAERRGGTLAVVDKSRTLSLLAVSEEGKPGAPIETVRSRFEELAELLQAKKDEVRAEACSALALLPEDEARKALDAQLASDRSPTVRRAAAAAMASSNRRLSRPALRTALSDPDKDVRAAALRALETIDRDAPVAAARAALASTMPDIRSLGVARLPSLREQSPLVPALIADALSDRDAEVRGHALDALYALEAAAPLQAARIGLARGPADVRREVLIRIGRSRKALDPVGAELIEGALDDADESVRSTAFLSSIAARSALIAKVRIVDAHTSQALAELEAKGSFADAGTASDLVEADLRPLFAAMACRAPDTALRAARLLALFGDARATGALLQLSREADTGMRRNVVEALMGAALAMPGDDRVLDRLRWLIDDPEETVRQAAFDVLQMLAETQGAGGELDLAELALRASHSDLRVRSLPILVKFGGTGQYAKIADLAERADVALGDALDDEHDKVRGEAFRTLWAWHSKDPRKVLERAATCRQPEVRSRVIKEIPHQTPAQNAWADLLLLSLVEDHNARVGIEAYEAATKEKADKERVDVHLRALQSPAAAVRVRGLKGAPKAGTHEMVGRIVELIRDEAPEVHTAAIEALDRLAPTNAEGFAFAFGSIFYGLRVRAMELCGRRRDARCVEPIRDFLAIPEVHINRPSDELRQRAARAIADVGAGALISYYGSLLEDGDPIVREMGSRGLATACAPGDETSLVAALGHEDLAVRSWVAEGLARLGDVRALPVLAGTMSHDHLPIRRGAIMGFVALGPDGVRGVLSGLDDDQREIQDLVFAVIVARDLALSGKGEAPDLLLSALSARHPEIRFAAARILEVRGGEQHASLAAELVGPPKLEKASEMKDWPSAEDQDARIKILVEALASDHPLHRYAATQVLSLRTQALAFWRESKNLLGPTGQTRPRIPFTNWDEEQKAPRKRSWIHSLVLRESAAPLASSETERLLALLGTIPGASKQSALQEAKLVFGTYAGLVRQAPAPGEADETHRVRRDAIERLAAIAADPLVGQEAVMPVLRRALSDPHHMVRRAAVAAVRSLYPQGSLEPLRLELRSSAADVGRGAVNELCAKAAESAEALALAKDTVNAPVDEVRRYGLSQLPQLFASGSLEPWLLALDSRYADIRLNVVDRLVDSTDERVLEALRRAMESDHEDLRLRAASALAARGDVRTVDVLSGLLFSEDSQYEASEALVELCNARKNPQAAVLASQALIARLENDPDKTADSHDLLSCIERIANPVAADYLARMILSEDEDQDVDKAWLLEVLGDCLEDQDATPRYDDQGDRMPVFVDAELTLAHARELLAAKDIAIRCATIKDLLRALPGRDAEELLESLLQDRVAEVRVSACTALAYRARNLEGASTGALSSALREGRRELVLPAAEGLASRQEPAAFQPLLLVFKAGEQEERKRAIAAMGTLGDSRVLSEIEPFVEGANELEPEDAEMVPVIVEALGRMLPRLKAEVADRVRARVENLAREGSDELRERAITGLRHAGDERSRKFIESIAGDTLESSTIRSAAIRELGLLKSPKSEQVLADVIGEGDYYMGSSALQALELIFPEDKTRTQLLALASSDTSVSGPAAAFLSWFGDLDILADRLSGVSDPGIRARLRQGLIRRGACPIDKLKEMLLSTDVGDRADASWIVGASDAKSAASELVAALGQAPGAYAMALESVGGKRDATGRSRLDRAEEAWTAGIWAAQRIDCDASEAARAAAEDVSLPESLRVVATRYLAHKPDNAGKLLETLLSDRNAAVRSAAAVGLAALEPKESQRLLSQELADTAALRPLVKVALEAGVDMFASEVTRRAGVGQMIERGRVDEIGKAAAVKGEDPGRFAAIAALGRLGGPKAEGVLAGLLEDASEADAVRAATYRALRSLQRRAAKFTSREESR